MASSRDELGQATADRLTARSGDGLSRRRIGGRVDVFSGRMVDRAMGAMGGGMRGFTMDSSIFMPSHFDPSDPDDVATAVHEYYHQQRSGGDDGGGGRQGSNPDTEERRARVVEQMVHQRAAAGESVEDIVATLDAGGDQAIDAFEASGAADARGPSEAGAGITASAGYAALQGDGLSHEAIVEDLKTFVVEELDERRRRQEERSSGE